MVLIERIALHRAVDRRTNNEESSGDRQPDENLYVFTAQFFTGQRVVEAELSSADFRLSDHLNGSTEVVDIGPSRIAPPSPIRGIDLARSIGQINKAHVRFVIPIAEPERPSGTTNALWEATAKEACWVGTGPYQIMGNIHTEAGRDARIALRLLDRRFLPLTDVTISTPDGSTRLCSAIIVNRASVDVLALQRRSA